MTERPSASGAGPGEALPRAEQRRRGGQLQDGRQPAVPDRHRRLQREVSERCQVVFSKPGIPY